MPDPLDIFGVATNPLDLFGEETVIDPLSGRRIKKSTIRERLPSMRGADPQPLEDPDFWGAMGSMPDAPGATGVNFLASQIGPRIQEGIVSLGRLPKMVSDLEALRQRGAGPEYHPTGEQQRYDPAEIEADRLSREDLIDRLAPDVLQNFARSTDESYQAAKGRIADLGLPPALSATLDTAMEAGAVVGDPLNFIPAGKILGAAKKLRPGGAVRAVETGAGAVDDMIELAAKSLKIGGPEAVREGASAVGKISFLDPVGKDLKTIAAVGADGKEVGHIRVRPGEDGHLVDWIEVTPEHRRQGVGQALHERAAELYGPRKGSTVATTPEGEALAGSLRRQDEAPDVLDLTDTSTDSDLLDRLGVQILHKEGFGPGARPEPLTGSLRPPETSYQFGAGSLDLPATARPGIKEAMESPEVLARRRTGVGLPPEAEKLRARLGLTEDDFITAKPGKVWNQEEHALLESYTSKWGRQKEELLPVIRKQQLQGLTDTPEMAAYYAAKDRYSELLAASIAGRSEIGRAMRAFQELRTAIDSPQALRDFLARKLACKGVL